MCFKVCLECVVQALRSLGVLDGIWYRMGCSKGSDAFENGGVVGI